MQALSFSDDAKVTAPLVFAGYGLVVPESQNFGYDSYAGLDVKDKIVLVLHYFPEDADHRPRRRSRAIPIFATRRSRRASAARKALLVVTGPRSPNAGQTLRMTFDTALAGSGIPAASISGAVANALFAGAPKSLAAAQKELDSRQSARRRLRLCPSSVDLTTKVVREKQTGRNVVAYLPANLESRSTGSPTSRGSSSARTTTTSGTARAAPRSRRKDEAGQIHHGADDNASGTAAVLAIAAAFGEAAREPRATSCSRSGPARRSGSSARTRS